jgi:hypothetical protein
MRISTLITFFIISIADAAFGRRHHHSLNRRVTAAPLVDTCLSLPTSSLVSALGGLLAPLVSTLHIGKPTSTTPPDLCLCASALPLAIESNADLALIAGLIGTGPLEHALAGLVRFKCFLASFNTLTSHS